MPENLSEILWEYLLEGRFFTYFSTVFNTYFPFGLFFWVLGFVIFIIIQFKTKSLGYGGAIACVYFVVITSIPNLVTNAYSQFGMRYFGVILGIVSGYYLYRGLKG